MVNIGQHSHRMRAILLKSILRKKQVGALLLLSYTKSNVCYVMCKHSEYDVGTLLIMIAEHCHGVPNCHYFLLKQE